MNTERLEILGFRLFGKIALMPPHKGLFFQALKESIYVKVFL